MPRFPLRALILGAALLVSRETADAQEPTEDWKKAHTNAAGRVEGFDFPRKVAAASLSLVSFSAHRQPFDPAKDRNVSVGFFAWADGPMRVIAREMTPLRFYWMEEPGRAQRGPNQWPNLVSDALRTATPPLDGTNLGVVIRLPGLDDEIFNVEGIAPVFLHAPGSPLVERVDTYQATFLPDATIDEIRYSLFEGCGKSLNATPVDGDTYGRQYRGRAVTLPLTPARPGLTTLTINYKVEGKNRVPLKYCFWHVPTPRTPPATPANLGH